MLIPFGILSAAGAGGAVSTASDYELISTTILGSAAPSVTFDVSTFASTYKHLQIRAVHRDTTTSGATTGFWLRFNGVSTSSYWWHRLSGNGVTVASDNGGSTTRILTGISASNSSTANGFSATVIDILDPYSTTKNTTIRALCGVANSGSSEVNLNSGLFNSTASITSVELTVDANIVAGSRFSIYGIKGD